MTTTITGFLKASEFSLNIVPDSEHTISVQPNLGLDSPFLDGCFLHQALPCLVRPPQSRREWQYFPLVTAIEKELRGFDAQRYEVEKNIGKWDGQPSGRADVLIHGSGSYGVAELKVVKNIPRMVRPKDGLQLGAYLRGAARHESLGRWWAALVYVDVTRGQLKVFSFRSSAIELAKATALAFVV